MPVANNFVILVFIATKLEISMQSLLLSSPNLKRRKDSKLKSGQNC
jgi:hypothetical protein